MVMASLPSGVAIVTTVAADDTPRGLTIAAVCSVSADPPTVLVHADLGSCTLDAPRATRRFVVNFIGEGRSELCLLFASKAEDKFAQVSWRPPRNPVSRCSTTTSSPGQSARPSGSSRSAITCSSSPRSRMAAFSPSSSRSCTTGARGRLARPRPCRAGSGGDSGDGGQRTRPSLAGRGDVTPSSTLTVMSAWWDTRSEVDMLRAEGERMWFSLYTEMQLHEGKSPAQLYGEVSRADRERGPARLRLLRVDRALLLPEVLHLRRT